MLAPEFGLATRAAEQASVGMLAIGIATIVARRQTVFHLLGLVVAENGIALAAVAVPGGLPLLIELGVAFDLVVVITVATAFHRRIFSEFGTGDTAVLRGLRD
jgi:hydrogenase-4 component E